MSDVDEFPVPLDHRAIQLQNSVLTRILFYGSGEEYSDFLMLLARFERTSKEDFERFTGICHRLEFIDNLRFHIPKNDESIFPLRIGHEMDRLSAYLSATCLEIIATGKDYTQYPGWISKKIKILGKKDDELQEGDKRAVKGIIDLLKGIMEINDLDVAKKILKESTDILYDLYLDQHGLNRSFKNLFGSENMPNWLREWVSGVYIIWDDKNKKMDKPIKDLWNEKDLSTKCLSIAGYLYSQVRNKYTHTVEWHPSLEDNKLLLDLYPEGEYKFAEFHQDGDYRKDVNRIVGIKKEFAESNVIKLIAIFYIRKMIGVEDDVEFIWRYWDKVEYKNICYSLLGETRLNTEVIKAWCAIHLFSDNIFPKIEKLKNTYLRKLIDIIDVGGDKQYWEINKLISYNAAIERYNENIDGFISQFTVEELPGKWIEFIEYGQSLVNSPGIQSFVFSISDMEKEILGHLSSGLYWRDRK